MKLTNQRSHPALCFLCGALSGVIVTTLGVNHYAGWLSGQGLLQDHGLVHKELIIAETSPQTAVTRHNMAASGEHRAAVSRDRKDSQTDVMPGVRLLCWILTYPDSHRTKAAAVRDTWGKRCDQLLFMSDTNDTWLPSLGLGAKPGRSHLTDKSRRAFDHVYRHHFQDADWFLKADDDTYVIVENLRHMLSAHAPSDAVYFGEHFVDLVAQGYFSGGAGYVLSKEALRRYGERSSETCLDDHKEAEDVFMGQCLQGLGVRTGDARDEQGRARFHCMRPSVHLHGEYKAWYFTNSKYTPRMGLGNMSHDPISFHYMSPQMMLEMEYYLYHVRIHGGS